MTIPIKEIKEPTYNLRNHLSHSQIDLIVNSQPYSAYLDYKAHSICSYKDLEGNFKPYFKNLTSKKLMDEDTWRKNLEFYKTMEKAKDMNRLITDGINGIKITHHLRVEVSNNNTHILTIACIPFTL